MKLIKNEHTLMSFDKAEALAKKLNSDVDDKGSVYEVVPTPTVGQYAIACFTLINGELAAFEGFL